MQVSNDLPMDEPFGGPGLPDYFEVDCNTSLTNKFSGFVAIPLKDFSN